MGKREGGGWRGGDRRRKEGGQGGKWNSGAEEGKGSGEMEREE